MIFKLSSLDGGNPISKIILLLWRKLGKLRVVVAQENNEF
jgi:hypothetical protein